MALRIAVVTGSNQGIGKEVARKLLKDGCKTVLACRNLGSAEAAAEEMREEGLSEVECRELDISNRSSIENFVSGIERDHGHIDILVNNAGTAFKAADPTPFEVRMAPFFHSTLYTYLFTNCFYGTFLATSSTHRQRELLWHSDPHGIDDPPTSKISCAPHSACSESIGWIKDPQE